MVSVYRLRGKADAYQQLLIISMTYFDNNRTVPQKDVTALHFIIADESVDAVCNHLINKHELPVNLPCRLSADLRHQHSKKP